MLWTSRVDLFWRRRPDDLFCPLLALHTNCCRLESSPNSVWGKVSFCISDLLIFFFFFLPCLQALPLCSSNTLYLRPAFLMPVRDHLSYVASVKVEYLMLQNSFHWTSSPFYFCPFPYLSHLKLNLLTPFERALKFVVLDSCLPAL